MIRVYRRPFVVTSTVLRYAGGVYYLAWLGTQDDPASPATQHHLN